MSPREAASETLKHLEGAFALAFLFDGEEDLIVAARKGSPLAIGHGDGEMFVGSDAIALGPLTDRITYLDEGDYAFVTRGGVEIRDAQGRQVHRDMVRIAAQAAQVDKAGHKHFMAKEDVRTAHRAGPVPVALHVRTAAVQLARCGPRFRRHRPDDHGGLRHGHYACLVAKYWFEQLAGLPCDVDIASEFRYREPPVSPSPPRSSSASRGKPPTRWPRCAMPGQGEDRGVAGQCPAILHRARKRPALPILAGVEIGVASTKAFMNQLGALACLAIVAGRQRGHLTPEREAELVKTLLSLPALINQALALEDQIRTQTGKLAEARSVLFLGRGPMFPMALEGALKLKEISYIHAEAYASGELKHGPIALVDNNLPVIVLAPRDALFDKTVSNMQEVMARDGKVWLISDADGVRTAGTASGPR
jgi:glucosamine--fructose-6-phosphate aminotransferase (isomerizing)